MYNETRVTFLPQSDILAYSLGKGIRFIRSARGLSRKTGHTRVRSPYSQCPLTGMAWQVANYSEIQLSTVNGVDLTFMKTLQWRGERISGLTGRPSRGSSIECRQR